VSVEAVDIDQTHSAGAVTHSPNTPKTKIRRR
jgi:hypothetical protein